MPESRKRKSKPTIPPVINPGSIIRMEQPKSGRAHKENVVFVAAHELNPVSGFVGFLKDNAIAGVAIGFIIGLQAQGLVKALISSFIDPAFKLLFGEALSKRDFTLHFGGRSEQFVWGDFAHVLLNFVFVLAAIYLIFKIFKLDKFTKPKDDEKKK
jgi:large-conductance mechanosensitive channel